MRPKTKPTATADAYVSLPTRQSVKRKFEAVAKAKRWNLSVTADEAIAALAAREGIDLVQHGATP